MIDMYLAGVSTRQVDDISRLLWCERMPFQTLSDKPRRLYAQIDEWRNRPLERECPYLFMDGVWHKRAWGGLVENAGVLVSVSVDDTGHREVIDVAEGMKEDKASWEQFVRNLIERGLKGVRLFVFNVFSAVRGGDGMLDSLSGRSRHHGEVFEGTAQARGGVVRAVRA